MWRSPRFVRRSSFALLLFSLLFLVPEAARVRKVQVEYPVALLPPIAGSYFESEVSKDLLTCFSNRDYAQPSFLATLLCMLSAPVDCTNVWGSRRILVETQGSVEFLLTHALPTEGRQLQNLNVTRWLQLTDKKEVKEVPAEPLYLCARSSNWQKDRPTSSFVMRFHPAHIRHKDRLETTTTVLMHILLFPVITSAWLLPALAAAVMAFIAFQHGLKFFIVILGLSSFMLLMLPFAFTRRNRVAARKLFASAFSRVQAEEAKHAIRQKLPVLQALILSCLIMCLGSAAGHVACEYFGLHWETRNFVIQCSFALAAGWLSFFLCRAFDRFCRDWIWVGMSYGLAKILDRRLNPACHDEVMIGAMAISITLWAALPRLLGYLRHRKLLLVVFPMAPSIANFFRLRRNKSLKHLVSSSEPGDARLVTSQDAVDADLSQDEDSEDFVAFLADSPTRPGLNRGRVSKVNLVPSKSVVSTASWFSAAGDASSTEEQQASSVNVLANRDRLEETLGVTLNQLPSGVDLQAQGESIWGTEGLQFQDISAAPSAQGMLGVLPLPVYAKGPLLIDNVVVHVPLATYDGTVVECFQRGAAAIMAAGIKSQVSSNVFSQWAIVAFSSLERTAAFHAWLREERQLQLLQNVFRDEFFGGWLISVRSHMVGRKVYIKAKFTMGDAPVLDHAAAAVERVLIALAEHFDDMEICSVGASDSLVREQCLLEARGAVVTVEVCLDSRVVQKELGCTVTNFITAANMRTLGAHDPLDPVKACIQRTVTALFLATGQDPAVASASAHASVHVEAVDPSSSSSDDDGLIGAEQESGGLLASLSADLGNHIPESRTREADLRIAITLPSVVAGPNAVGTTLGPEAACLYLLKLEELSSDNHVGSASDSMARVVGASVLAAYIGCISQFAQSALVLARGKASLS